MMKFCVAMLCPEWDVHSSVEDTHAVYATRSLVT